jgi:hypothetical protein
MDEEHNALKLILKSHPNFATDPYKPCLEEKGDDLLLQSHESSYSEKVLRILPSILTQDCERLVSHVQSPT